MARPLRIHPAGGFHHVTARGNDRLPIFLDDGDRWSFLQLLSSARERFGCEFHAYCLMTNHIHLVIEDHEGNLSASLRHIKGVHAQRFNRHHDRSGHLFEGRFWNSLLGDDAYVANAVEYVHRNPAEAGMVGDLSDYPWSSYPAYLGRTAPPSCLTLHKMTQIYGGRQQLRDRTERPAVNNARLHAFEKTPPPPIIGSEAFCRSAMANVAASPETSASARRCDAQRVRPCLSLIASTVADEFEVAAESLRRGARGRQNTPRAVAIHLAVAAGVPLAEVAQRFGLTSANAASTSNVRLARKLANDPELADRVDRLQLVVEGT